MPFKVTLRHLFIESGISRYKVTKEMKLSHNTTDRYFKADTVEVFSIEKVVPRIAAYFGKDWKDLVEYVDEDEE